MKIVKNLIIRENKTKSFNRKFLKNISDIDGNDIERLKNIKLQILKDLNF